MEITPLSEIMPKIIQSRTTNVCKRDSFVANIYGKDILVYQIDMDDISGKGLPVIAFRVGAILSYLEPHHIQVMVPNFAENSWQYRQISKMTGECPEEWKALFEAAVEQSAVEMQTGKYEQMWPNTGG